MKTPIRHEEFAGGHVLIDAEDTIIVDGVQNAVTAQNIVKAVNCHQELVTACRGILNRFGDSVDWDNARDAASTEAVRNALDSVDHDPK